MVETRLIRTVCDANGSPILEIIKENDTVTIFEADDMDHNVKFPSRVIQVLIQELQNLK